jgi:hypothetical protein
MSTPEARLAARARRAYERGRLRSAALRALPLVPLVGLATAGCAAPQEVLLCGAVLLAAVTGLLWRGEEYGAGVGPGVAAGLLPLLLPVATRLTGHPCSAAACYVLPVVCALGGLAGGILLGLVAPSPRAGRRVAFVAACAVAALTGAVGCLMYGLVGLVVMGAGLVVGVTPLVATRRA